MVGVLNILYFIFVAIWMQSVYFGRELMCDLFLVHSKISRSTTTIHFRFARGLKARKKGKSIIKSSLKTFQVVSSLYLLLNRVSFGEGNFEVNKCLVISVWCTCTSACGCIGWILLLEIFFNQSAFCFLQIQFKEKVLWTAITLFIFLVCCQVSKVVFYRL